jgi:hypothetical protein
MFLIFEIALGVFFGFCLLGIVFGLIPEWLRRREIERNYQRSIEARFKRAREQGSPLEGIVGLYELEKWEQEHDPRDAWTIAQEEVARGISAGRMVR